MPTSKRIIILAANPRDTSRLRLDEEVREIKEGLRLAKKRDLFEIEQREAVRIRDLRRALLDCEPQIVHFSGHGEADGIMVEDESGNSVLVEPEALAGLFDLFSDQVECVLLNACFSESQADAINKHIGYVIGMKKEIGDKAAIEFAVGFYDALGAGRSYKEAFKFGRSAIELYGIPEHLTPVLKINPDINSETPSPKSEYKITESARIFISYKHDVTPDEIVAIEVSNKLKDLGYYVFIDRDMTVGMEWMKRIDEEIRNTDFLIPFLSEHSIHSEMVKEEIEKAHHLAKEQEGRPQILPVRLDYREQFQYPINQYLDHINWAIWDKHEDTSRLINELIEAISGKPLPVDTKNRQQYIQVKEKPKIPVPSYSAQPITLEMPEGTMDPQSAFYVERLGDQIALETIKRQGATITIKAPRQMGKSSLLIRIVKAAKEIGKRVAFLDFQLFDKSTLSDSDVFFPQFCSFLTDELNLENRIDDFWKMPLGNCQRCSRYVSRYLLKELNSPVVLAMDEVEKLFDTDFRSDFFSMLRNWHNCRATSTLWKQLDLALVTSTEPYQFIENINQSPFNVGEIIELSDFTLEQVKDLNHRHGSPLSSNEVQQLMSLLSGHPYLVRKALYLVASNRISAKDLFTQAIDDRGPFGDHLRNYLFKLYGRDQLIKGLMQVIQKNDCSDDRIFFRLRGAGLIRRKGQTILPRCRLYADYFREHI